ncbi:MAG: hypothetical protein WC692_08350 [Erythrobacter sp.]|jgi:hypothetical protein
MRAWLTVLPFLLLAGCDKPAGQVDDSATVTAGTVVDDGKGPPPPPDSEADGIPAALHGRWGLVVADCTSTAGDAKGLVEISGDGLKFYESRATVGTVASVDTKSIHAQFDFSGEGQTWTRDMTLTLGDGGGTLVRSETGEDALAQPLTYSKCP